MAFFPWRYTTHSGFVFYSPLLGFSLLTYEVTWSHTATRHSRDDSSERMISPSQRPLWRIHETGYIPDGKIRLVISESLYSECIKSVMAEVTRCVVCSWEIRHILVPKTRRTAIAASPRAWTPRGEGRYSRVSTPFREANKAGRSRIQLYLWLTPANDNHLTSIRDQRQPAARSIIQFSPFQRNPASENYFPKSHVQKKQVD